MILTQSFLKILGNQMGPIWMRTGSRSNYKNCLRRSLKIIYLKPSRSGSSWGLLGLRISLIKLILTKMCNTIRSWVEIKIVSLSKGSWIIGMNAMGLSGCRIKIVFMRGSTRRHSSSRMAMDVEYTLMVSISWGTGVRVNGLGRSTSHQSPKGN